jgi:deoxyribodipyrimidine photolyase-related protein
MRNYCDELTMKGYQVHYQVLSDHDQLKYEESLLKFVKQQQIKKVHFFEIEDKFFEKRLLNFLKSSGIEYNVLLSPMFLTSRTDFSLYLKKFKKPFMKSFYEGRRKQLKILVDASAAPIGGKWSYDEENRLKLPRNVVPPAPDISIPTNQHVDQVIKLVTKKFSKHPGDTRSFWIPTTRHGAMQWLKKFINERLVSFGPYEDALPKHSTFVFHSVLTPFLNVGLLTPQEVVDAVFLIESKTQEIPLASLEGFIRQIIGWREFVRGIYQNFSEQEESTNFWGHHQKLSNHWYVGNTGIAPLDDVIKKVNQFGYAHHIERLMVVGNLMLLLEISPKEAHRWFMEMFVDSSDWVMGPNVYGMALFSDGGIFATKPYICGSNYYRKMGDYKASEEWCDGVDGLYWQFIEKHKSFFKNNHRLSMMVRSLEKINDERKKKIYHAADKLRNNLAIVS